ncbi:HDOD domain-containing protein [Gimesia algae]|uniref:HDOD domain-containing protein n=1 Tax=Gimesia algae TaxID=2527971 RepID=UPI0018D911AF|nr:HDOD domain-containing protein [Gimesia algae]
MKRQTDIPGYPPVVESAFLKIKSIATLPAVARKVMELVDDSGTSAEDLRKVIATDPALSACILKIVNSSFYGFPQQIGSIERAVVLLGLNAIKNIAIASSLSKVFKTSLIGPQFNASDLWLHSVAVASCARQISVRTKVGLPDEVFLAGLIHDIGIMMEMQVDYTEFMNVIQITTQNQHTTFRQAENDILGANHELFGGYICREWKFPVHFEYAARYHHDPLQLPAENQPLPLIIHVADVLAARLGEGYSRTVETQTIDPEILSALNLREADIELIMDSLAEAIEETHQLLGCSSSS